MTKNVIRNFRGQKHFQVLKLFQNIEEFGGNFSLPVPEGLDPLVSQMDFGGRGSRADLRWIPIHFDLTNVLKVDEAIEQATVQHLQQDDYDSIELIEQFSSLLRSQYLNNDQRDRCTFLKTPEFC